MGAGLYAECRLCAGFVCECRLWVWSVRDVGGALCGVLCCCVLQLGHEAYRPGTLAHSKLVEEFGEGQQILSLPEPTVWLGCRKSLVLSVR